MNTVATLPAKERAELFRETAARRGFLFQIVEKDFWVCWTLKQLFGLPEIGSHLIFKGGTSLSKIFRVIERFSEDIDVSIARDYLGFEGASDPENEEKSKGWKRKQIEALTAVCEKKIKDDLLPALTDAFTKILGEPVEKGEATEWELFIDDNDSQTILFAYPQDEYSRNLPGSDYIKPVIRIELGARSDHYPAEEYPITPYAAEEFPDYFEEPSYVVKVLAAERTFWEKATILHDQYNRTGDIVSAERISRHYYDLYKLSQSSIAKESLKNLELLARVVEHKSLFFARAAAHYEDCLKGEMHLIPGEERIANLSRDYKKMEEMFFDDIPRFSEIIETLERLERQINSLVQENK